MLKQTIKRYRLLLYAVAAGLCVVLYSYLTPPLLPASVLSEFPFIRNLPGDFSVYAFRFLLSTVLLGLAPLLLSLLFGEKVKELGLRIRVDFFKDKIFYILLGFCLLFGYLGSLSADLAAYYPYSRTLIEVIQRKGLWFFLIHLTGYFFFYYLPWEFFFRGFLIFPFIREIGRNSALPPERNPGILAIASFQVLPSALLHFGHPLSETIVTVFFGLAVAYIAVKTKSIIPGLIFHSVVGITLDLFIIVRILG